MTGKQKKRQKRNAIGYSFILPNFIGYFVFIFVPIILILVLCVMKWDGPSTPMESVELKDFAKLFHDNGFRISVTSTLYYAVFTVPLIMVTALLIVVLLDSKIKGIVVYRTAFFFPYVASPVAVDAVWNMLFQPELGPVNEFFKFIDIASSSKWCASTDWVMTIITIVSVWKYMGYYMVVYLATLQGISQDLYEAAGIDGTTGFRRFRHTTILILEPTTFLVIIMMTIQCFKVFNLIYVMTGDGPGRSTNVLMNHIYNVAFVDFKFNCASASTLMLFAIVLVVTLIQFQGEKKFTDYVQEEQRMGTRTLRGKTGIYMLLSILAVLVAIPFGWMFPVSVKTNNEVFSIPMKLSPKEFQQVNYQTIQDRIPLLVFFKNTFRVAVCTTLSQVLTSCFAAYGFSKVEFKGRDFLFLVPVTTFAVPWQAYTVPQPALISRTGFTDSHLGLILMQVFSGFGVFLIRQFMIGVPNELLEAVRIDGLSEYRILTKITLPLVKPDVAALMIFTFVNIWDGFMGPLIYLNSTKLKTIQLDIRMFTSRYRADYALITVASVYSLVPVLVVFIVCQKWFVEGITASDVKG